MSTLTLSAQKRSVAGKKVKTLRNNGELPVVLYGNGIEPVLLTVEAKPFNMLWKEAGTSQLVDVTVDGEKSVKALIHDYQIHPVSGALLHADLYQVNMKQEIETEIPLKFIGESAAVKDLEGNLITEKDALEIRCLPADLVAEFEVDLSVLKTFDDVIKVSDVKVPSTIEVLNDADEVVALVTAPRSEEELEAELSADTAQAEAAAIADIDAQKEAEAAEGEEADSDSGSKEETE